MPKTTRGASARREAGRLRVRRIAKHFLHPIEHGLDAAVGSAVLPGGGPETRAQPAITPIAEYAHPWIVQMLHDTDRAIGGTVVDQQKLPVVMRLREHGAHRVGKVAPGVQKRDADGNLNAITHDDSPVG